MQTFKIALLLFLSVRCYAETYQLVRDSSNVKRLSDNAFIPNDPGNRDWVAYQEWVNKGNVAQPAPTVSVDTSMQKALVDVKSATSTTDAKVKAIIVILGLDK